MNILEREHHDNMRRKDPKSIHELRDRTRTHSDKCVEEEWCCADSSNLPLEVCHELSLSVTHDVDILERRLELTGLHQGALRAVNRMMQKQWRLRGIS